MEVISISLDNKREFWLQALKEDQVQWIQVIDESGFEQSRVRAAYKVEQVPTVYLIGPDGNILLKNPELQEIYEIIKTKGGMRTVYCIVSILLLLHIEGWAQREAIILKNVNIVDVVEGSIHKGQDVVMKGGIIQAIGKDVGTGIAER